MSTRANLPAMNADDVAARLGLNRKTVYKLAKIGELGSFRIGRKLLFSEADVQAYLTHARAVASDAGAHTMGSADLSVQEGALLSEDTLVLAGDDLAGDVLSIASIDSVKLAQGLSLIPLQTERVDLAVKKSERTRPFLNEIVKLSKSSVFVEHIAGTTKGAVSELGSIVYEC